MPINSSFTNLFPNRKGFTLLEIMIAVFILVTVLTTVYAAYRGTFRIIKQSEEEGEGYGMARTVMDRIFRDLSSVSTAGGAAKFVFRSQNIGLAEITGLTFTSGAHLAFSEEESLGGLAEITYYIDDERSGENGYTLRRKDLLQAEAETAGGEGRGFVLCERLQSLRFTFIDSQGQEYESWDSASDVETQKNKPPSIVAIELKLKNPREGGYPYIFATKVFLPMSTVVSPLL